MKSNQEPACAAGGQNVSPWRGGAEPGDLAQNQIRACEAGDRLNSTNDVRQSLFDAPEAKL